MITFCGSAQDGYGQLQDQTITPENHDYSSKIAFVYGSEFLQHNPELLDPLVLLLRDRIAYQFEVAPPDEKFPKLSSFPLMNKANPSVNAPDPAAFDVTTFNPLIYNWDFFSDRVQVFRIDGTDYLMIVQPQ
jgi:hypothetical protein